MTSPQNSRNAGGEGDSKKQCSPASWFAIGLPTGIAIGTGIGAATENMGTWVGIGVALGMAFAGVGAAVQSQRNKS